MHHLLICRGTDPARQEILSKSRTYLGRDRGCDVVLRSPTHAGQRQKEYISHWHAIITKDKDGFLIEDGDGEGKESHNGTFVNGETVPFPTRLRLKCGDVIQICDFTLTLCEGEPQPVEDAKSTPHDSSLFLTQPEDKLRLLLKITNRLSNTLEIDTLLPQVVDILMEIFKQADRGFLIMQDAATGELMLRAFRPRKTEDAALRGFSSSIVRECLQLQQGRHSNNLAADYSGSESVAGLALQSVICAPLCAHDGTAFGVLQLDSRDSRREFTREDLSLLEGVAVQASIALTNAQFHEDALEREAYEQNLKLARLVVKSFLPEQLPEVPGYEFFASYESAQAVGGDYYDLLPLSRQRLAIMVGDVAGKGVPAALVMARFSAEARAWLRTDTDLAAAIGQLNALMAPLAFAGRFVTLAALVLDPATHTLSLINAGHFSPIVLRKATGTTEEVAPPKSAGPLLGVFDGYDYQPLPVALAPGDSVILYTDGVTDAMDVERREFTKARLVELLKASPTLSPKELGEAILQAVKKHAAGCRQHDDITLVCFGRR
jgi:serine phosphatase RsbU (regulator of sigma subunit)/pSer/pThr/pTyr-binding forkhead associated (FHA) protein